MAGYIRQSSFVDGDTITAALFNDEYNQLVNAFSNTDGHKHDGTTAEGPVIGLIGDAGETSPNNKVLIDTTNNYIEFYVEVSSAPVQQLYIADGAIIPVTDSDIDLGTTSLRFKDTYTDTVTTTGNVTVGGNLTVTGNATISGNLTFGDADTDSINLAAEIDSDIIPNTDGTYDLGSATKEWQDLYIDGTANIDSLVADTADINAGTIDNTVIGGTTAVAGSFTTATATTGNITNVNATTVDTTNIEVTNIKAKDGTSAGSIADTTGVVTLASSVLTTTDINGGTIDGVTIGGTSAGAVTFTDLSDGTITIANFIDDDTFGTASATTLPTSESVKAYVDSQVTAQDLDFQGDTGGALSIDLDSETLTIAGGTGIDTVGATNTLTVSIDSTVTTLTGTQTLTNKTLTSPVINTGVSGTAVLDDDTFATASATTLATSESIKAYVDTTVAATNEVVEDTTPQLGGNLDLNSYDITGTGNINNTGTITTDGLTVDGTTSLNAAATITAASPALFFMESDTTDLNTRIRNNGGSLAIHTVDDSQSSVALRFDLDNSTGDIAFYNSLGNSQSFYWDASAESLGIGTTSPSHALHIVGTTTPTLTIGSTTAGQARLVLDGDSNGDGSGGDFAELYHDTAGDLIISSRNPATDSEIIFQNNGSERVRIDSSGNVGIGTSSPSSTLEVSKSDQTNGATLTITNAFFGGSWAVNDVIGTIDFKSDDASSSQLVRGQIQSVTDNVLGNAFSYGTALTFSTAYNNTLSEAMRIDSSGNVGIGTDSPAFTLDAYHATNNGIARFTSGDADAYIALSDVNTTSAGNQIGITTDDMWFKTSNTERVRIDSTGNVGIGTTSPDAILHIEGSGVDSLRFGNIGVSSNSALRISRDDTTISNNNPLGYLEFGGKANTGNVDTAHAYIAAIASGTHAAGDNPTDLTFGTTPDGSSTMTEVMRINSSGKVGIGTDAPARPLHILTAQDYVVKFESTDSYAGIILEDNASTTDGNQIAVSGDNMRFYTAGSESLRISGSGNIGIGTTSPQVRLSVDNSATGGEALRIGDTSGAGGTIGETYLGFTAYSSGTTQTYPHAWIGVLEYDTSDQKGILTFGTRQSNADVAPTEAMRIDSSGNVGIGTSSPSDELDISSTSPAIRLTDTTTAGLYHTISSSSDDLRISADTGNVGANTEIEFYVDGSERMRIDSSGNVGINTTSPQAPLHARNGSSGVSSYTAGTRAIIEGTATTYLTIAAPNTSLSGILFADPDDSDNGYIKYDHSTGGVMEFATAGSEAMRITSDGRLQFANLSATNTDLSVFAKGNYLYALGGTGGLILGDDSAQGTRIVMSTASNYQRFDTSGSERMRLLSGGALCIGTTNATSSATFETITATRTFIQGGSNDAATPTVHISDNDGTVEANSTILSLGFDNDDTFANANYIRFIDQTAEQGVIEGAGAGSVSYTTSSDKRRKENVEDAPNYLEKIKQIEVKKYNFIGSEKKEIGMLAQDLYEIIPEPVRVGGDNEKSNPWGIDYGKLTPFLVKAIQEQQTLIEQLQAEVALLKGE